MTLCTGVGRPATIDHLPPAWAVVGAAGHAGRLYADTLTRLTNELVVRVDSCIPTNGYYPGVESVPTGMAGRVALWSVCTPTSTHLQVAAEVLRRCPCAVVLMEKPLCPSDDWDKLDELVGRYPEARILVSDVYRHSRAVLCLLDVARRSFPGERPHQVVVDFVKDRRADEDAGRFIDTDYGILGYEWFHQLTLLHMVLDRMVGPDAFARYLRSDPDLRHGPRHLIEATWIVGLPQTLLHSALDGQHRVKAGRHAACAVEDSVLAPDRRYRVVVLRFVAGSVSLQLEPLGSVHDPQTRNRHEIVVSRTSCAPATVRVTDDHFRNFMRYVILQIRGQGDPVPAGISSSVREVHQRLGRIAASVRCQGRS